MKLFSTNIRKPYIGAIQGVPMNLNAPTKEVPKSATLRFDWASYGVNSALFTPVLKTKYFFGGAVTIPSDYQSKGATMELVGGGGPSTNAVGGSGSAGQSGGGGAYAKFNEPPIYPGVSYFCNVGGSPAHTWFNFFGLNIAPTSLVDGCQAASAIGNTGGSLANSIGHVTFKGGDGSTAGNGGGGGGGGAAGPNGAGAASSQGSGGVPNQGGGAGGGANGGFVGNPPGTPNGGQGGSNRFAAPGGAGGAGTNGGTGLNGAGGGGGSGAAITAFNGGANSGEVIWTETDTGNITGPSSGAGGGGSAATTGGVGGATGSGIGRGGGAGAPGRSTAANTALGNSGDAGIIVLKYYSTTTLTTADIMVDVNLQQGVVNPLERIVAVNIDNTDSNVTIYVRFDDSGQTIVAPPGAIVYETAVTQSLKCQILAEGFTNFVTQPTTQITFTNRYIAPQTDYEQQTVRPQFLGSVYPNSPVLNQSKFRYQAVGDLMYVDWIELDGLATPSGIAVSFLAPITTLGYYVYITDLTIFVQHSAAETTNLNGCYINLSDTTGVINYNIPYLSEMTPISREVLNLKNAQIKIPAASKITLQRLPLTTKSGSAVGFPKEYCLASIIMNYSIVDERQAE